MNATYWLTLTIIMTAVLWLPYILHSILHRGLMETMGYDDNLPPLSDWAVRAKRAHYNGIENLVLFAPVVILAPSKDGDVATAAMAYFIARALHYVVYVAKIPVLRTLTFFGGWAATLYIAYTIIG
ncbi:MAG: MAPEG family protein [Deltaproteobacteria bacterium]